ncbi:MAG: phage holin family protein [Alphaproteobacteria bacterium]|nr:phage holin family protein [Alphaproteobacteria bacterium]
MAVIQPMITQMVLNSLLTRASKTPAMRRTEICLLAACGMFLIIGVVFLFVALHAFALVYYVPWVAATITGGAALIVGLCCAVAAGNMEAARKALKPQHSIEDTGEALLAALGHATQGLEKPISENPRTSVLLASLAGYLAGDKLH